METGETPMTRHYSEADLLETYYMQPGQSMPVMMHLADCTDCRTKYERLERKLREAATCNVERPATFWSRQRLSIMRRIDAQRAQGALMSRNLRVAAAALLAFFLGGAVVYKAIEPGLQRQPVVISNHPSPVPAMTDELQVPHDPWQSDELQDFHGVVQWESWVSETKRARS
jgi:hypothetical protein